MIRLRPKYKMELMKQTQEKLFAEYSSYARVETYISQFQIWNTDSWGNIQEWDNFGIHHYTAGDIGKIDVPNTLAQMPEDDLIRIAVDLGIPVPMILPSFPTFERVLTAEENGMSYAQDIFVKSYKLIDEDPAQSIALANSALESIIKHILEDPRITIKYNRNDTLSKLTESILKEFEFYPSKELQNNIKCIGSSLLTIANEIEILRSDKTPAHGKGKKDYTIDDNLYSVFVLNSIMTVGMFLISYFNKKYGTPPLSPTLADIVISDDIPF